MRCSGPAGALAALAAAASLGGCMQSTTYGTGEVPEMAIFREMTGGLGANKKEKIDYQPRAPLVMPPSNQELPPPAESTQVANAAWPLDPDKTPKGSRYQDDTPLDDISPAEFHRLKPLAGRVGNPNWYKESNHYQPALDVINTKQQHEFKAALDDMNGVGHKERRYLTEPPLAYREPAATAPTEFEDIKKKRAGFFSRLFGG